MTIRAARRGDEDALSELGRRTFSETFGMLYSAEDLSSFLDSNHATHQYADWISDPETDVWLMDSVGGDSIGYALLRPCHLPVDPLPQGALELSRIYVRASAQGSGLGSALLAAVFKRVEARGRPPLFLSVFSGNTGAQRLYARHGFRHVGEYEFIVGSQRDREFIWRRD